MILDKTSKTKLHLSSTPTYVDSSKSNTPSTFITAKGDSAASHHYWRQEDIACLSNMLNLPSTSVLLPNANTITSSKQGILPLSSLLSTQAKKALVLPQLQSSSLISLGQLCDDDCTVQLNKHFLKVFKNKNLIMKGIRNQYDGLWDIPVNKTTIQHTNCIIPPSSVISIHNNYVTSTLNKQKNNIESNKSSKITNTPPNSHFSSRLAKPSIQLLQKTFGPLEHFVFDNIVDNCTKQLNKKEHRLNVIVRKKTNSCRISSVSA